METNHWGDQFWDEDEQSVGQNHLGLILMEHRTRLAVPGPQTTKRSPL